MQKISRLEPWLCSPWCTNFFIVVDICNNYINLTDAWRKIYEAGNHYQSYCDREDDRINGNTWFRFVSPSGTKLPASPNPRSLNGETPCGTHRIAWMTTPHPTILDGIVLRDICFAWSGKQCDFGGNFSISVAACPASDQETFYIYQLKKPTSCRNAYCALGIVLKNLIRVTIKYLII